MRFGIVGTGKISGTVIAGGRFDSRFDAHAIYSRSIENGREFAKTHNIEKVFNCYTEMLCDPMIDAVYIASPNSMHAAQTIAALQAGKHVLCEKAFASNRNEVKEMVSEALRNNRLLMEAMKTTVTPNFIAVRDNLHHIGKIGRYFSSYCQYSSRYDAFIRGEVMNAFKPELSNGALVDIGIYTIYPMVLLFGLPKDFTLRAHLLSTGVDGQGTATFHYDTMDATVIYSKIADSSLPTEIQGQKGTITLNRINNIEKVTMKLRGREEIDITRPHIGHDYFYEIAHFIDAAEKNQLQSSINTLQTSTQVMELLTAMRKECGVIYPADKL